MLVIFTYPLLTLNINKEGSDHNLVTKTKRISSQHADSVSYTSIQRPNRRHIISARLECTERFATTGSNSWLYRRLYCLEHNYRSKLRQWALFRQISNKELGSPQSTVLSFIFTHGRNPCISGWFWITGSLLVLDGFDVSFIRCFIHQSVQFFWY